MSQWKQPFKHIIIGNKINNKEDNLIQGIRYSAATSTSLKFFDLMIKNPCNCF